MGRRVVLKICQVVRSCLEKIVDRGSDWRQRQRAKTLILLDDGLAMTEVAAVLDLNVRTVGSTRTAWLAGGVDSLADAPRSGAPKKISPEQRDRIADMARTEPLTATALLARHIDNGGAPVHLNTLKSALKDADMVWKRTRHSLRKRRDEVAFRAAQVEIEALRAQAASGQITVAFVDEAGFSQVHPNRSAWTPRGEQHLIDAKRGKRLNVLAALISDGDLFSARYLESTTSGVFAGFLGLLHEHVQKPLVVILDNASIHKAKAIQPIIQHLKTKGITLYFLPAYSPELNRIERLWHMMKHTWMSVKGRTSKMLDADIDEILSNFGTKYKFSF